MTICGVYKQIMYLHDTVSAHVREDFDTKSLISISYCVCVYIYTEHIFLYMCVCVDGVGLEGTAPCSLFAYVNKEFENNSSK